MFSLYSKYRPQTFEEIIGQSHIINILKAELLNNKISHAYLFVGPRGTGKTTTARVLAKALNCTNLTKDGNPCGKCDMCKAAQAGNFLDIIEIDAASNRRIDEIRSLKEKIEYQPAMGKYKVYIIDEVHMLTREAFNALLKTLEEPPSHVVFILATTEPHKVPVTIASRCERFEFRLGGTEDLRKTVFDILKKENVTIDDKAIDLLIEHASGSYRDLLSLLDSFVSKGDKHISFQSVKDGLGLPDETMVYYFISSVFEQKPEQVFEMLNEVFLKGTNLNQFLKTTIATLRDIALKRYSGETLEGYEFIEKYPVSNVLTFISLLLEAYSDTKHAFDLRLPIQLAILRMLENLEEHSVQPLNKQTNKKSISKQAQVTENIKVESKPIVKKVSTKLLTTSMPKKTVSSKSKPVKKSKVKPKSNDVLSFDEVKKNWKKFIESLKPYNGHLYAFLLQAIPKHLDYDSDLNTYKLTVAVKYKFHKQRIELAKSQEAMQEESNNLFGVPIRVLAMQDDSLFTNNPLKADKESTNISKNSVTPMTKQVAPDNTKQTVTISTSAVKDSTTKESSSFQTLDKDFDDIFNEDTIEI